MKKIIFWILAFGLTGAIQLSSAVPHSNDANNLNVLCKTSDNKQGYCKNVYECPHSLRISVEMSLEKRTWLTNKEFQYMSSVGSRECKKETKTICCDYRPVEGINQLLEQECGQAGGNKVSMGSEIVLMSRPWLALLKLNNSIWCGGSIIHKRFVLTAAHCVDKVDLKFLSVLLGEHQTNTTEDTRFVRGKWVTAPPVEELGIEDVYIHEEYNSIEKYNDIALVKLPRDVMFQKHIKPICLPLNKTLQKELKEIANFKITGWGATESSSFSHVPREATIPKRNGSECRLTRELKSTELCAGANGKDMCHSDSGGPLIEVQNYNNQHKYVQYGIAGYGKHCSLGNPSVYTSVSSFIPWIAKKIGPK